MTDSFQKIAALLMDPRTRGIAMAALRKQYGVARLEQAREYAQEFRRRGLSQVDAELAGIAIIIGMDDMQRIAKWGPTWAQNQAQLPQRRMPMTQGTIGFDWGRAGTALLTGGASEAARAVSDDVDDFLSDFEDKLEDGMEAAGEFLKEASKQGWENFKDAVEEVIDDLDVTEIRSIKDALNLIKTTATLGIDKVVDKTIGAIQDALFELIVPYMREAGEWLGKFYGNARSKVVEGAYVWFKRKTNKVVAKIMREFLSALYDLLLGYPPCVCEEGCIAPVAKGLKEGGNPYVKAVGEALTVIWPFCQGRGGQFNLDFPEASTCLYLYANKLDMLAQAKIPEKLENVLSIIGDDFTQGMPQSFNIYKNWLVDEVARGADGPLFQGGDDNSAKYYFERPFKAIEVIKKADKIVVDWFDDLVKYVNWISMAYEWGTRALDAYDAIKDRNFDGELSLEKLKELDLSPEQIAEFIETTGCNVLVGGQEECDRLKKGLQDPVATAEALAEQYTTDLEADARNLGKEALNRYMPKMPSVADIQSDLPQVQIKLPQFNKQGPGGFSGISTAQAFMGEWQIAQIGLEARAKWNKMAKAWCDMSQEQRLKWKRIGDSKWKREATDYGRWFDMFRDDRNLRDYCLYQQMKKQTPSVVNTLKSKAARGAVGSLRPNVIDAMQSLQRQEYAKILQKRVALTKKMLPFTHKAANYAAALLPKKLSPSLMMTKNPALLNVALTASQAALPIPGAMRMAHQPVMSKSKKKSAATPFIVGGLGLLGAVALVAASTGRKK